jgi:hypothetical protein
VQSKAISIISNNYHVLGACSVQKIHYLTSGLSYTERSMAYIYTQVQKVDNINYVLQIILL